MMEPYDKEGDTEFERITPLDRMERNKAMAEIAPELRRPRQYNETQLSKVGVEVLDRTHVHLRCKVCGTTWSPNLRTGGKLPRGYWKCPNGCNASAK